MALDFSQFSLLPDDLRSQLLGAALSSIGAGNYGPFDPTQAAPAVSSPLPQVIRSSPSADLAAFNDPTDYSNRYTGLDPNALPTRSSAPMRVPANPSPALPGLNPYVAPQSTAESPPYVPAVHPQALAANFSGQLDALNRGQAESDRYWGEEAKRQAWNQAQVNAIEQPHDINPINVALAPLRILGGLIGGVRGALQGNVPYIGDTGFSPAQEISTVTGQQITQPQDNRGALGGILDFLTGESARKDAAYHALGQSILRNYGIQWKQDEANANELLKRAEQLHGLAGSYSELQNSQSNLGRANAGIFQDIAQAAAARAAAANSASETQLHNAMTEGQNWKNRVGYEFDQRAAQSGLDTAEANRTKSAVDALKTIVGLASGSGGMNSAQAAADLARRQQLQREYVAQVLRAAQGGKGVAGDPAMANALATLYHGSFTPGVTHWSNWLLGPDTPPVVDIPLPPSTAPVGGTTLLTPELLDQLNLGKYKDVLGHGATASEPVDTTPDLLRRPSSEMESAPVAPTINGSTEEADFAKLANQNPNARDFINAAGDAAEKSGMSKDQVHAYLQRARAWGNAHPDSFR